MQAAHLKTPILTVIWFISFLFVSGCYLNATISTSPSISVAEQQNESTGGSGAPIDSGISQPFVLFQDPQAAPGWSNKISNRGNGPTGPYVANGVKNLYSIGAYVDTNDGNKLKFFANDRDNHRILIFNQLPTSNLALPDVVVGQVNFTSGNVTTGKNSSNPSVVSQAGFDTSAHVTVCANGYMFVADSGNHRVLGYNKVPTSNGAFADFVIGQPDFSSKTANNSSLPLQSQRLNTPFAVHCLLGKLYILDRGNSRVLVYNTIPTNGSPNLSAPAADLVIGQPDLNTISLGSADYSISNSYLNTPYEISSYDGVFYIADGGNHRILVYKSIPNSANTKPDYVIGQPNSSSNGYNNTNTTTPTQSSLYFPNSMAFKNNKMAVSDHTNYRILFFNLPITKNGPNANYILGKSDYVTGGIPATTQMGSFGGTKGLIFDGSNFIWVVDGSANNRIQVLNLPY